MADVGDLVVEAYPLTGATKIVAEESTVFGWIEILNTASIGTYPAYTLSYEITTTTERPLLRYKWELGATSTIWLSPLSLSVAATDEVTARLTQAVLAKAVRILLLVEAPLGTFGELSEFGQAAVRPDYQQTELLYGLRFVNWADDLSTLVSTSDVIRAGLQAPPADFPSANLPDVTRAIDAAASWVGSELLDGAGIA